MTSPYTRGDSLSSGASLEQIKQALLDYGATDVLLSHRGNLSAIAFKGDGRQFRIVVSLPQPDGTWTIGGDTAQGRVSETKTRNLERVTRRFWHALALAIDAKLALVVAGVATLESEFLAHVVLPGNRTILDELEPIIDSAYKCGRHPSLGDSTLPLLTTEP
jgi:hypothetical protein